MVKEILKLLREDRGAITADWLALVGGIGIFAFVIIGSIEEEIVVFTLNFDTGSRVALN